MANNALDHRVLDSEMTLGQAIELLRKPTGMSARALSLAAGLSESYCGKVEKGEIEPSVRAFGALAIQLGLGAREVNLLVTRAAMRSTTPVPAA